jgi:hypothetical protein
MFESTAAGETNLNGTNHEEDLQALFEGLEGTDEGTDEGNSSEPSDGAQDDAQNAESDPWAALPETLPIRYNKEDVQVSRDQLKPLVQKGYAYDATRQERDQLMQKLRDAQSNPALQLINELAQSSGMSVEQYVQFVQVQQREAEVQRMVGEGMQPEMARRMIALENQQRQFQQQQAQYQGRAKVQTEISQLRIENPDIKSAADIPQEVYDMAVETGAPLSMAYASYKARVLERQLSGLKQAEKNKRSAIGSASGDGAPRSGSMDDFLKGLAGD